MQGPAQRIVLSSARKFINMGALSRLWNLFKKLHSADIASILNHLTNRERLIIFNVLYEQDREKAAEVVSELEPEDAAQILKEIPIKQITEIFHLIASDDIAPILQQLPEEMQSAVLDEMEEKPSEEVKELLHYEEETAGRIMSTNFYALNQETNVSDAITAMQLEGDVESAFYLYVVDDEGHLVGVVSLRQLLFARPNTKLKEIMNREVISVRTDTDQEFVARAVADYNLVAIPVVDEANKLVGVVTVDDVIDVIDKEATEDIYKMVSLDSSDSSLAPLVVNFFKGTIQQAVTLAVMMPLVAALGGVAGNQTIAIMVREIAIGQADWLSAHKILLKEMLVGLGNGLVIGSLLGAATFLLFNNPYLGLIMGLAIIINLFVAALLGTLIPLTLKLLRLDPALGSVNFLTMCTDSVGMLSLLGLGTIFLKHI